MAIGKLDVQLGLDTAEFTAGVNKAEQSLSRFSSALSNMAANAVGHAIGQAMVEAMAAVSKAFTNALDSLDKFKDAAAGLGGGGSAAGMSALVTGLTNIGISSKAASEQVTTFAGVVQSKLVGEATNATRGLEKLGVSVTDATGKVRPMTAIMTEAATKLGTYKDDAFRAAAAQELFGKNTAANNELMAKSASQITAAAAAASGSTESWQRLSDTMTRMAQASAPVMDAIGGGLAAAANTGMAAIEAMAAALGGQVIQLLDTFGLTAKSAGDFVNEAFIFIAQVVAGAISAVLHWINEAIASFQALANAAISSAKAVGAAMAAIGAGLAATMNRDFAGAKDALSKGMDDVAKHGKDAANSLEEGLTRAVKAPLDGLIKMRDTMNQVDKDMRERLSKPIEMTIKPKGGGASIGSLEAPKGGGGGGKGKGGGGGKSELEKELDALEKYAEAVKNAADPQRVFTAEMEKFTKAAAAGLLTMDQYAVAVSMATKKMEAAAKSSGLATPMLDFKKGIKSWGDEVAGSLSDAIIEGDNLNDVFKNLIKSLAKMALELLVLKPLMNSLTSGLSGGFGFGGLAAPMAAAAPAGFSAFGRAVPTTNALASGIIYPRGPSGRASSGGGTKVNNTIGDISMNITPEGGTTIGDTKQGQQFGERVRMLIQREMVQQSQPGGLLRPR